MNRRYLQITIGTLCMLMLCFSYAGNSFCSNYLTSNNNFIGGGGWSASSSYKTSGAMGMIVGTGSSLSYMAQAGFMNPTTEFVASNNHAPTITGFPDTKVSVGTFYNFTPVTNDSEKNLLTFSITNKPSWATFNPLTGKLSGTPTSSGTYSNITITVSDGDLSASLAPFSIDVATTEMATVPVTSGTPVTVAPSSGITVTFATVTQTGTVSVVQNPSPPAPPANFQVLSGNNFLLTTSSITYSGSITVCLDYDDSGLLTMDEAALRMFHHNGTTWQDVTILPVNIADNVICGSVSSFSPFIVAKPLSSGGSGSGTTAVPIMEGWWLLPGVLVGLGMFARRRKE